MTKEDLVSRVKDYVEKASLLEAARQGITRELTEVAQTEIIPQIESILLPGYSFAPNSVKVHCLGESEGKHRYVSREETVPTAFGVYVKLFYRGKKICPHDDPKIDAQVMRIQMDFRLKELAERYNLATILPVCEELHF